MTAYKASTSKPPCPQCGHEWMENWREDIFIEGQMTEASIQYRKCPQCHQVQRGTNWIVIESSHHPNEGQAYSCQVPADGDTWLTPEGDAIYDKLIAHYLTSRQVEAEYNLKPGAVRQAVKRGYITAKKDGHDLFILESVAEEYWGHRNEGEE